MHEIVISGVLVGMKVVHVDHSSTLQAAHCSLLTARGAQVDSVTSA